MTGTQDANPSLWVRASQPSPNYPAHHQHRLLEVTKNTQTLFRFVNVLLIHQTIHKEPWSHKWKIAPLSACLMGKGRSHCIKKRVNFKHDMSKLWLHTEGCNAFSLHLHRKIHPFHVRSCKVHGKSSRAQHVALTLFLQSLVLVHLLSLIKIWKKCVLLKLQFG